MEKKICKVEGCGKGTGRIAVDKKGGVHNQTCNGYCSRHYNHFIKYNRILKRTVYDKNEIICKGDICEIILYEGKS